MSEALSVTKLVRRLKNLVEIQVGEVWVEGEISNFKRQQSGHLYFTLKDSKAQIPCAMFKGAARYLDIEPEEGMSVKVFAETTIYEAQGKMQLIVRKMERVGLGNLYERFEKLKAKLNQEGLFDAKHKQPLPKFPKRIGLVTSPTSAALQDMLNIFFRRWNQTEFFIIGTRVQGQGTELEIVHAIEKFNQSEALGLPKMDLLIIGRGGGSIEDLWNFNEEVVARAIFASKVPIISAVGHEIDHTIADFVSDLRAPTPSAAAELAVPSREEVISQLKQWRKQSHQLLGARFLSEKQRLEQLRAGLQRLTKQTLEQKSQQLDFLQSRLQQVTEGQIRLKKQKLELFQKRLEQFTPQQRIKQQREQLTKGRLLLRQLVLQQINNQRESLLSSKKMLEAFNPQNVLDRGYSITMNAKGEVVKNASKLKSGALLTTRLKEGEVTSVVSKKNQAELF